MEFDDVPLDDDLSDFSLKNVTRSTDHTTKAPPARRHKDEMIEEASKISGGEWQELYKRVVGEAFRDGLKLIKEDELDVRRGWRLIDEDDDRSQTHIHPVLLFELEPSIGDYARTFKVTSVVRGRPDRFLYVIKDHDNDTRSAWDAQEVISTQQLETYSPREGDIQVVKSHVRSPLPMLTSHRFLLGVQSAVYNAENKTHVYVFKSAPHYYFKCPPEMTQATALVCIWLSAMSRDECEIKMVVAVDAGNLWTAAPFLRRYENKLRERIVLWQRVVDEWDRYYGPKRDPKKVENRK